MMKQTYLQMFVMLSILTGTFAQLLQPVYIGYGCNWRFPNACSDVVPHSYCYRPDLNSPGNATCQCDAGYIHISGTDICQGAQSVCPDGWVLFDGSCYLFNDKLNKDWTEATLHCASLSAKLVTIESKAEDDFLQGYSNKLFKRSIRASHAFWAGATDAVTEGSWRWYNRAIDSQLLYKNWAFGQPNVWTPNVIDEDCLCLFGPANFQWHDVNCRDKNHFICERLAE